MIILIILIIPILLLQPTEHFASILDPKTGQFKSVEQLKYKRNSLLLDTQIQDQDYCEELCKTSEGCNGYNFALNKCTLYRNAKAWPSTSWLYFDRQY